MKYYIASPFFDETSRNWVEAKEEEFKGFNIPFFSPRQDGVNFNKEGLSPELRSERIKGIFNNNIRQLKESTNIVCNLNYCNGKVDIGTLFELGYFVGNRGFSLEDNFIDIPREFRQRILDFCKYLSNASVTKIPHRMIIYHSDQADELFEESLKFNSMTKDYLRGLIVSEFEEISLGSFNLVLVDNFPLETVILLGFMYSRDIPYYTCSFRGFGSNVMIAASSKGHIQIPGFVDDTYKRDIL